LHDITEIPGREQAVSIIPQNNSSNTVDNEISTSSESIMNEENTQMSASMDQQTNGLKHSVTETVSQSRSDDSQPLNQCMLCLSEEKRLACIPCGHLATCVPCGYSLRSCPICRRSIEAFVRIYI
jgi:hypothetical protein